MIMMMMILYFISIIIIIIIIITDIMDAVYRCIQYLLDATNTISPLTPCRIALLAKPIFT